MQAAGHFKSMACDHVVMGLGAHRPASWLYVRSRVRALARARVHVQQRLPTHKSTFRMQVAIVTASSGNFTTPQPLPSPPPPPAKSCDDPQFGSLCGADAVGAIVGVIAGRVGGRRHARSTACGQQAGAAAHGPACVHPLAA